MAVAGAEGEGLAEARRVGEGRFEAALEKRIEREREREREEVEARMCSRAKKNECPARKD
jgi:hypothetical protein